jgi:hypothetical protein
MHHPVLISIGPKHVDPDVIQAAITMRERQLGRPLTSTEVLEVVGACHEPDESKRIFLSAHPPKTMPKLHLP